MNKIYQLYYYFLFKIKDPKKVISHPRYNKPIKFGFTVGNRHYYRMTHDYDIYKDRFGYLKTYYEECERKLTTQDIKDFCQAAKEYINKGKPIQAGQLLDEMEHRGEWLFEPTSLFKYASVIYFDLQEDIKDYDVMYCNDKIRYWVKKKSLLRLLLKELMTGAENLLALSNSDFTHYLSVMQKELKKQQKLVSEAGLTNSKRSTAEMTFD